MQLNQTEQQRLASSSPKSKHSQQSTSKMASTKLLAMFLLVLATALFRPLEAKPVPDMRNEYPSIDLRLLDWPRAQKVAEEGKPYSQLECYTELDRTFVDPSTSYRLNNSGQLSDRACMLRIPTGTRLNVLEMHVHSKKSYVTVLAGSSQVFMPLRTEHIHAGETDRYGPWHVPCQQAYVVFRSRSARLEWVEFRLSEETEEDRNQADSALCTSEGVNHAEMEYGDEHSGAGGHSQAGQQAENGHRHTEGHGQGNGQKK